MVFKTNCRLMQFKSIAECSKWEHSAILSTFINLPFVIKTFVLSIFEWPFYTGFTVNELCMRQGLINMELLSIRKKLSKLTNFSIFKLSKNPWLSGSRQFTLNGSVF